MEGVQNSNSPRVLTQVEPTILVQGLNEKRKEVDIDPAFSVSENPLVEPEQQKVLENEENQANFLAGLVIIGALAVGGFFVFKWITKKAPIPTEAVETALEMTKM